MWRYGDTSIFFMLTLLYLFSAFCFLTSFILALVSKKKLVFWGLIQNSQYYKNYNSSTTINNKIYCSVII